MRWLEDRVAAGLSALEVSVQAVGDAMKTALENGTALTVDVTTSAITAVANASGFLFFLGLFLYCSNY